MKPDTKKVRVAAIIIAAAVILGLFCFFRFASHHEEGDLQDTGAGVVEEQMPSSQDGTGSGQDGAASSQDGSGSADSVYNVAPDASVNETSPGGTASPVPVPAGGSKEDLQQALMNSNNLYYYGNVPNDITGKWRYSGYTSTVAQENLALDYYKAFFTGDDEIHALINYAAGNTARITVLDDNTLDVTILEHIEGEEHDADTLFNGRVLVKYWVYKDTGQILEVKPD